MITDAQRIGDDGERRVHSADRQEEPASRPKIDAPIRHDFLLLLKTPRLVGTAARGAVAPGLELRAPEAFLPNPSPSETPQEEEPDQREALRK
jgi:hypothetical protein